MASTGIGFRWLDILEKEFDTNFVDLDIHLGELEAEDPDIVCNARHKMSALSSCFAQLTHKAQTIFQNSAKVEAELVNLRAELIDAKVKRESLEQELRTVVLELHAAQLVNKLPGNHAGERNISGVPGAAVEPKEVDRIRKRLQQEIDKSPTNKGAPHEGDDTCSMTRSQHLSQLSTENTQLHTENTALRNSILALHSEVYGAKLAAKYLDKELAGRIQQLQLLGREMRGEIRDKLWRQLESEILLQRHKTVVRACRRNNHSLSNGNCQKPPDMSGGLVSTPDQGLSDTRFVTVKRNHGQGLGISITGGREHGVPILISELEANGPAALSNQLYIGDAILSVNGIDLKQACHREAVQVLQQQTGDCLLMVQYIAAEDSDTNSLSEDGYNFQYRFFDTEVCDSTDAISLHPLQHGTGGAMANTPTAPRTPEFNEQSRNNSDDGMSCPASPLPQVSEEIYDSAVVCGTPEDNGNASSSPAKVFNSPCKSSEELITSDLSATVDVVCHLENKRNGNYCLVPSPPPPLDDSSKSLDCDKSSSDIDNMNINLELDKLKNKIQELEKMPSGQYVDRTILGSNAVEHEKFFENNRTIINIEEPAFKLGKADSKKCNLKIDTALNISSNSLLYTTESDNASSPIQTSTDNFLSSDVVSNNSDSPKSFLKTPEESSATKTAFVVKNFKTELYEPKVYNNNLLDFTENLEKSLYLSENFHDTLLNNTTDITDNVFKSSDNVSGCDNESRTSDYVTDTVLDMYENISGSLELKETYKVTPSDLSEGDKTHITNLLELQKFQEFCKSDDVKNYSSNSESFSNTSPKSGRSFNASCPNESYESSPVHQCVDLRKNLRKMKTRKSHGVKTIQSIFRSSDYLSSDISSANSDFNDELDKVSNLSNVRVHSPMFSKTNKKPSKHLKTLTKSSSDGKSPPPDMEPSSLLSFYKKSVEKIESPSSQPPALSPDQLEFERNIHSFLSETFSKTEVQLPNLKIINSVQKTREKITKLKAVITPDDVEDTQQLEIGICPLDPLAVQPVESHKEQVQPDDIVVKSNALQGCTNYVDGFLNSLDRRLASVESEYSDDNADLVQYERNLNTTDRDMIAFPEEVKNIDPVYIDEKRLKENKEKLLERYVRANHQNMMNLEGNGDPDFGTPV